VAPRSAGPKKLKQKKQPTLWDDEAEDDDEDGVDEDREKEPDSEDERFIDDAPEQSERSEPEMKQLHWANMPPTILTFNPVRGSLSCLLVAT
jgi:hypothetical protein